MDTQELQILKNRFGVIGNDLQLNHAIEVAMAVAPTDLSVLVCGESGVGKEVLPKIIHQYSRRRNGRFLAINCGAIPPGTINAELFGHEKDGSFHSSIGQIYQTWDGIDLYPSVEEKAAMLLYLVVKNHSFSDGNKRIAATLFLWFMENNRILYGSDGHKRIADNALVALTLMIAESKTDEMDMMVKVVVNLINGDNK